MQLFVPVPISCYDVLMRLGAFELNEPLPDLNEPHAFAILRPWIDVGNVGSLTLSHLESHFEAVELGKLVRPGNFFDFTRYRPTIYLNEDRRELAIPNATILRANTAGKNDFLFLRLLEPHMLAETYVDSVLKLFTRFGVKRYCLFGSMLDMVPYTRPFLITGRGSNMMLRNKMEAANVWSSDYVGPTSITMLISQKAAEMGIETISLIVHLPNYLTLDEDFRGMTALVQALAPFYDFPAAQEDLNKAKEQADSVSDTAEQMMQQEPRYRDILRHMEASYDSRVNRTKYQTKLTPELERLLQDLGRGFNPG